MPADEYEEVIIVDPHLLREYTGDKLGILDVKVKTKTEKTIDIEIQVKRRNALRERIVFSLSKMVTGQIGSGNDYSQIKRSISIFITDFVFVPENTNYQNRYTLYDPQTKSQFTNLLEVNILELPKLPPDDGTELWNWMKFLSANRKEELDMVAQKSPQVQKAVARLMELSNDERTRMLYESRQMMEWDNQVREQEVSNDRATAIAKSLLEMDLPIEKIVLATGLTREQVEALA
ncbi:MAG: Rpn family recombination-promoting nuclease/putative transposase [Peptococcaceae bacterium]|nr:Rpn family recombination-promoting nuclease/putative transposase [Peptococcaceae bacterium]